MESRKTGERFNPNISPNILRSCEISGLERQQAELQRERADSIYPEITQKCSSEKEGGAKAEPCAPKGHTSEIDMLPAVGADY
jgi:hypothetical protein